MTSATEETKGQLQRLARYFLDQDYDTIRELKVKYLITELALAEDRIARLGGERWIHPRDK